MNALPRHPYGSARMTIGALLERVGLVAADKAEEILNEVPATLKRLRTLLLVVSITVPVCALGLVVVAWHLVS